MITDGPATADAHDRSLPVLGEGNRGRRLDNKFCRMPQVSDVLAANARLISVVSDLFIHRCSSLDLNTYQHRLQRLIFLIPLLSRQLQLPLS